VYGFWGQISPASIWQRCKGSKPGGPYNVLIGYSFGGLVTLEMAQQRSESGKHAALLALLETYPHRSSSTRFT
jgi:acetoacetyl-CoA synthetase